jgi:hypothetical protein
MQLFVPRTQIPKFRIFFLIKMLEQVSLLSNKMRHLRVCKTPWKLRFDEEDNNVRLKIVWDVRIFAMNVQVQAV